MPTACRTTSVTPAILAAMLACFSVEAGTIVDFEKSTPVTLHVKSEPEQSVADKLAAQVASCRIVCVRSAYGEKFDPVTLDLDNQPFLVALARLGAELHGRLNSSNTNAYQFVHVSVGNRRQQHVLPIENELSWLGGPSQSVGPFLVVVRSINRSAVADLENPSAVSRSLNVVLNVLCEPQVAVIARSPWFAMQEVTDDKGNSLAGHNVDPPPSDWFKGPIYGDWQPTVILNHPAVIGKKIARLKGLVRYRAVSAFNTIEMPVSATAPSQLAVDDLAVTLTPAKGGARNGYRATLSVACGQMDAAGWKARRELLGAGSRFRVFDSAGKWLPQYGVSHHDDPDGTLVFDLNFGRDVNRDGQPSAGPVTTLVWDVPLESKEGAIPVELNDLPLP